MKKETGSKFDLLPVLGFVGLLFVILYFLLTNIKLDTGERPQQQSRYYLFYKLYRNLGYHIKDYSFETIPRQRDDMAICFDYDRTNSVFTKAMNRWIDQGGTLLIAGIQGDRDPLTSSPIRTAQTRGLYLKKPNHGGLSQRPFLKTSRESIRYFADDKVMDQARVVLYSDQGPMVYRIRKGAGSIIALSDSALLNNNFLRHDNLAVLVNQWMAPSFSKRIYILHQEISNRQKAVPILALLFKGQLIYLTLQLLWILMLFIVWQGKRFGEPQFVDPFARRTLSEHLKAVGQFYQKTNALRIVDAINSDYFKYKLAKKTGLQLKVSGQAEDLEKIQRYLSSNHGEIEREQLMMSLRNDAEITIARLLQKETIRDTILKSLRK